MGPKFSVVIPAYKQAEFLGDAIESVLTQNYQDFELIVVNDASPDHSGDIVAQYNDPRLLYIIHSHNKGLPTARNTGIQAASGENIALLDADDYFHPDKLSVHATFLADHPEVGVTYNPRFDLNYSAKTICSLHRPKTTVDLSDLVSGFPFAPSDMVIRREWVEKTGLFDEALINGSEDMDYPCRLALAGSQFASVDQALNYRRYHLNRPRRSEQKRKSEYDMVQDRVFRDPRCPDRVRQLRDVAISKQALSLSFVSFTYEDTDFAQGLLREAVTRNPTMTKGTPTEVVDYLLLRCVNSGVNDHGELLKFIFDQFPNELKYLTDEYAWARKQGYLMRGARAVLWGNREEAEWNFSQARYTGARIDETYRWKLFYQLNDVEEVMGREALQQSITALFPVLEPFGNKAMLRTVLARLANARAFRNYHVHNYQGVIRSGFDTFINAPAVCLNRGLFSIFIRAVLKRVTNVNVSQ